MRRDAGARVDNAMPEKMETKKKRRERTHWNKRSPEMQGSTTSVGRRRGRRPWTASGGWRHDDGGCSAARRGEARRNDVHGREHGEGSGCYSVCEGEKSGVGQSGRGRRLILFLTSAARVSKNRVGRRLCGKSSLTRDTHTHYTDWTADRWDPSQCTSAWLGLPRSCARMREFWWDERLHGSFFLYIYIAVDIYLYKWFF
jgi:hypothetical protein